MYQKSQGPLKASIWHKVLIDNKIYSSNFNSLLSALCWHCTTLEFGYPTAITKGLRWGELSGRAPDPQP